VTYYLGARIAIRNYYESPWSIRPGQLRVPS